VILHGDCIEKLKEIKEKSIRCVVTSPPYAATREDAYQTVSEAEYPEWTVRWMNEVKRVLTDDGSVLMTIRPMIKHGQISDYVMRTRLALRDAGWIECEELIWHKPDAPPLGSTYRPRRCWEHILWFSLNKNPYINLRSLNIYSDRVGVLGSKRFGNKYIHKQREVQAGIAKDSDVIVAYIAHNSVGVMHPAQYPLTLAKQLIKRFSEENDTVLDPFAGGGTTLLAAKELNRNFVGIELEEKYIEIIKERLCIDS